MSQLHIKFLVLII